ncbi:DUF4177 domain-containing protein [Halobacteria archaeon AArc-m2/3/4]|uniref:DUF4177 domain-containing protein n=1 Tax=Natronoglomus mannanivorans TaxID=2979990 RepID=A0ABT2QAH5_9EURY|nr:DUF4177 domain-containing protein [Halobacteria archaeon AArc-m2/3/4]
MPSSPVTTWEYETVRPPREATMEEADDPKDVLNDLGSDGWELVDTIDYTGGGTKYLVFKRPASGGDGDGDE